MAILGGFVKKVLFQLKFLLLDEVTNCDEIFSVFVLDSDQYGCQKWLYLCTGIASNFLWKNKAKILSQ